MKRQALILEVRRREAIVLTEDHEYLKIRLQPGFAVGQSVQISPEDLIQTTTPREGIYMKKKWMTVAASLVLVVAVGVLAATVGPTLLSKPTGTNETDEISTTAETLAPTTALAANPAVAVLAIDINPSLELQLDAESLVVAYQTMNQDAEKLQLGELVGLPAETAVEAVVTAAKQAGFIDVSDETDDFVVLSVTPLEGTEAEIDPLYTRLQERLRDRIRLNEQLQDCQMVMLRTTEQVRTQAHQAGIGLGLQVMNQAAVQAGLGEAKTVREFFANRERLQLMEQAGYMWQGQYGGSGEEGPGQGTQEQSRETSGTAKQGETSGTGSGSGPSDGSGSGSGYGPGPGPKGSGG